MLAIWSTHHRHTFLCWCSGPLGGVKNLAVTDPTMTSLKVTWDPADGAVRLYKVFFVPAAGGREEMVRLLLLLCLCLKSPFLLTCYLELFEQN